jgi:hypothetical protein
MWFRGIKAFQTENFNTRRNSNWLQWRWKEYRRFNLFQLRVWLSWNRWKWFTEIKAVRIKNFNTRRNDNWLQWRRREYRRFNSFQLQIRFKWNRGKFLATSEAQWMENFDCSPNNDRREWWIAKCIGSNFPHNQLLTFWYNSSSKTNLSQHWCHVAFMKIPKEHVVSPLTQLTLPFTTPAITHTFDRRLNYEEEN